MLYRPEERLFLAADQVIARISPNVSVHPMEPDLDALGIYLASLRAIKASGRRPTCWCCRATGCRSTACTTGSRN